MIVKPNHQPLQWYWRTLRGVIVAISFFTGFAVLTPVRADCTAIDDIQTTLGAADTAVQYNPFSSPADQTLTVTVTLNQACVNTQGLIITLGEPATTVVNNWVSGYPGLELRDGASDQSAVLYRYYQGENSPDVSTDLNLSSGEVGNTTQVDFTLRVRAAVAGTDGQSLAQGAVAKTLFNLPVKIRRSSDSTVLSNIENKAIVIPLEVIAVQQISLVDMFVQQAIDENTNRDFGLLNSGSVAQTQASTLYIWNNTGPTRLELSSASHWALRHVDYDDDQAIHHIPFSEVSVLKVDLNGLGSELLSSEAENGKRVTSLLNRSDVSGDRYRIEVSVSEKAAAGKRAGHYKGSITLKLITMP